MIRKITLTGLLILLAASYAFSQATLSSKEMIGITPMLADELELPADAKRSLQTKLTQMATQNGFGSTSGSIVLTANVVTLDKQVTATAPAMFVLDLEVSVYVVNIVEETVIAETSYIVKGIDRLENKAVIQAINQIKPRSSESRAFMNNTREKLIEYYNTRVPALITKAQSLADRHEYRAALAVLAEVPEAIDQYPVVAEQMSAIYLQMIDREAQAILQEARAKMAVRDYEGVMDAVVWVDPSSSHFKEATAMIQQIKNNIDAAEQLELEEQMRRYEDQMRMYEDQKETAQRKHDDYVMLEKLRIENAAKRTGMDEITSTVVSVATKGLTKWFLGNLF